MISEHRSTQINTPISLVTREKGLVFTVCACGIVCKACVKLCMGVSNDDMASILYDQRLDMSDSLLLCQGLLTQTLIAWTVLSMQDDVHTTSVSHNFVTRTTTHMQPDFPRNAWILHRSFSTSLSTITSPQSHRKPYKMAQSNANTNCQQCTNKCTVQYTRTNITAHRNNTIIRNSRNVSTCANSGHQTLFSDFLNGPGNKATLPPPYLPLSHMTPCDWCHTLQEVNIVRFYHSMSTHM